MPFNGSGTFTIVNTFVPNTTILSAAVNQNFSDIATGLSDCLTRDGQAGMSAAFKAIGGALGSPGISFSADATAGLYLNTTGIVALVAKSLGIQINSSIYQVSAAAVQAGGSNYAVGDTITLTGGTAINQAVLTVATLSGSAVATVTVTYPGNYSVKPADPVAQGTSSGIGTGASFNMTWTTQYTRAVVTDEASNAVWQRLGSSSFVSGLMAKANGLDFATAIGATNLATVISGSFLLPPQGVLTPVSSTSFPFPASDNTAVTRIYWTPWNGNSCPIFNGSAFVNTTSTQIFCDLTAGAQVLGGIYDVYKFLVSGTVTLGLSPSWSAGTSGSVTAGSCARGTSTGGTALSNTQGLASVSGIYTNTVAMTLNNGATTYSIAANQATYLGSVYVNAVAGQYNMHRNWGSSRVNGLWNLYNQQDIQLQAGDPSGGPWSAPASWRQSNNATGNKITSFMGLATMQINASFLQKIGSVVAAGQTNNVDIGIGLNSTTTPTGSIGDFTFNNANASAVTPNSISTALAVIPPSLGINNINCLEQATNNAASSNLFGGSSAMNLTLIYRA